MYCFPLAYGRSTSPTFAFLDKSARASPSPISRSMYWLRPVGSTDRSFRPVLNASVGKTSSPMPWNSFGMSRQNRSMISMRSTAVIPLDAKAGASAMMYSSGRSARRGRNTWPAPTGLPAHCSSASRPILSTGDSKDAKACATSIRLASAGRTL